MENLRPWIADVSPACKQAQGDDVNVEGHYPTQTEIVFCFQEVVFDGVVAA